MAGAADSECPACGASTEGDPWCSVCGLDLRSEDARRLRHLATVLAATEIEFERIRARRDGLAAELTERKLAANRFFETRPPNEPAPAFAPPPFVSPVLAPRSARGELPVDGVRNLLLWTGALLLALSALAFAAVAWTHLGPAGRAALLFAFTGVAAVLASASRDRLPASSGAFTGLTIALALVDWQVARRAGASGSLSAAAWWAIGTAVVGGVAVGMGRIAAPAPARRAVAMLVPGSAVLTVIVVAGAAWSAALGFALIAAALTATDRFVGSRIADGVVRVTLRVAAWTIWGAGAVLAVVAAFGPATFVQTLAPAAVMLALGMAPAIEALGRRPIAAGTTAGAFLVVVSGIGAALTLASTATGPVGLLTFAAVLGTVAATAASSSPAPVWRNAANLAGALAGLPGFVFAFVQASVCEIGPLAWLSHTWQGNTRSRALRVIVGPHTTSTHAIGWCTVGILAVGALGIAIASIPRRGPQVARWRSSAIGLGLVAIVVAPIAAGASARASLSVAVGAMTLALLGSAAVTRRRPQVGLLSGGLAVIPALPLAGWAALTPATSIAVVSIFVAAAIAAAVIDREATLRAAHAGAATFGAIGLAAIVTLASGGSRPVAGFVGAVVAGVALLIGVFLRRESVDGLVVEAGGAAGIAAGVLLTVPSRPWIAATLTAVLPLLLAASARRSRNLVYGAGASAAALGATWMWLAAAGVTVVEAYTLPAALLAFAAGMFVSERTRAWSWLSLGPAIVLALAPTLGLAIVRHDDGRAIAAGVAALVILLGGARRQLQAPLVLGAMALVTLGVDKVGPQAARLPRWTMLAIAGALLLWVGTTFERRRDEMHRAARRLAGLR